MSSCLVNVVKRHLNIRPWANLYMYLYYIANIPSVDFYPPSKFSLTSQGSSKLTWFYFGCTMQHLQTESNDSSLYLALPRYLSVYVVIVFSCVPSSPMGTDHINVVSSLMKVTENQTKPRVWACKPSLRHLPGIQMVQVYTSQHNALSLYTALFDVMCGSFVKSRHKSTFTECKTSDSATETAACVPS